MISQAIFVCLCFMLTKITIAVVYRSCGDALVENQVSGEYSIQPLENQATSNIFCNIINGTYIESALGNDVENNNTVNGFEYAFSYKKHIQYGNFSQEEVDQFLETSGECSQDLYWYNYFSKLSFSKFQYWDNSTFGFNNVPDGICKCFIRQICDERGSNTEICSTPGEPDHSPSFSYTGKLSVLPKRLPLRSILAGDTGLDTEGNDEIQHYAVGKLKCINRNQPQLFVNHFNSPCDLKKLQKLIDNSSTTCVKFNSINFYMNIHTNYYQRKFKISGKDSSCLNIQLMTKFENGKLEKCLSSDNCQFDCQPSPLKQYLLFSKEIQEDIEICEIKLYL